MCMKWIDNRLSAISSSVWQWPRNFSVRHSFWPLHGLVQSVQVYFTYVHIIPTVVHSLSTRRSKTTRNNHKSTYTHYTSMFGVLKFRFNSWTRDLYFYFLAQSPGFDLWKKSTSGLTNANPENLSLWHGAGHHTLPVCSPLNQQGL